MLQTPASRRPAWTPSLGFAVATTTLLALGPSTALAQSSTAQTQEPSAPEKAPAKDEPNIRILSLFDNPPTIGIKPNSVLKSWLSGVEMQCIGCPGLDTTSVRPAPTNANAPWVMQGQWRRQTTLGAVSTGFVGIRNYGLPLSTAMPLGGTIDTTALWSQGTSAFAPVSQWSLTAAVEKTLATFAGGASVGITADALIPVATSSAVAGDARVGALTSSTFRFGIVFRW